MGGLQAQSGIPSPLEILQGTFASLDPVSPAQLGVIILTVQHWADNGWTCKGWGGRVKTRTMISVTRVSLSRELQKLLV